ncbi:hypothetical protein B1759_16625 [Rubrivirga sp. SAORIC476]|uniref:hypothetical protein n=1 Tax=Rubrivirga sp. SAORIC476 TaxID=1961794 RepID=UPI000BA9B5C0|nr:hypothetical protein [Rubrivirga sp. SAORIC476]PAP74802.1 hypothetical protein B1759_16625 [Rubrivirga sp. SAORIC476]
MEPLYSEVALINGVPTGAVIGVAYGDVSGLEWTGPLPSAWATPPVLESEFERYWQRFYPGLPVDATQRALTLFSSPSLVSLAEAAVSALGARQVRSDVASRHQEAASDLLRTAEAGLREAVQAHASLLDHLRRSLYAIAELGDGVNGWALLECWQRALGLYIVGFESPRRSVMAQAAYDKSEPYEATARRLMASTADVPDSPPGPKNTVGVVFHLLRSRDESVARGERALADVVIAHKLQSDSWGGRKWSEVEPVDLLPYPFDVLSLPSREEGTREADRESVVAGLLATTLLHHGLYGPGALPWDLVVGVADGGPGLSFRSVRAGRDIEGYAPTDPVSCSRALGPYSLTRGLELEELSAGDLFDQMSESWSGVMRDATGDSLRKLWSGAVKSGRLDIPMAHLRLHHRAAAEALGLPPPAADLYDTRSFRYASSAARFVFAAQAVARWARTAGADDQTGGPGARLPQ